MSEWWTYRPSDLLMFSEDTYYRLFELYNRDVWPLQIIAVAFGVVCLALTVRGGPRQGRILTAILAVAWAWVGWAFLLERYATINWAAKYFAVAWFVQAALLGAVAAADAIEIPPLESWRTRTALALTALAVVLYPLIAPLAGRGWAQAEIFGMSPDPTAIASLGIALFARRAWLRGILLLIPVMWLLISGMTLWVLR